MKNFYLAIASIFILGASFGQYTYDIDISLTTPVAGSNVARTAAQQISFTIKNFGPDPTNVGDSLYIYYLNATQSEIYTLNGTAGGASYYVMSFGIPIGMSVFSTQLNGGNQFTLNTLAPGFNDGDVIYVVAEMHSATNGDEGANTVNNSKTFILGASGAGVEKASIATFSVYPNPAKDVLNVNSDEGVELVSIFSLNGKLISTTKGGTVDVSGLTTGVYLYNAKTLTGKVALNKFVKE